MQRPFFPPYFFFPSFSFCQPRSGLSELVRRRSRWALVHGFAHIELEALSPPFLPFPFPFPFFFSDRCRLGALVRAVACRVYRHAHEAIQRRANFVTFPSAFFFSFLSFPLLSRLAFPKLISAFLELTARGTLGGGRSLPPPFFFSLPPL